MLLLYFSYYIFIGPYGLLYFVIVINSMTVVWPYFMFRFITELMKPIIPMQVVVVFLVLEVRPCEKYRWYLHPGFPRTHNCEFADSLGINYDTHPATSGYSAQYEYLHIIYSVLGNITSPLPVLVRVPQARVPIRVTDEWCFPVHCV